MAFKQKLSKFVEWAHFKVFGHEMSREMKSFFGNLSWSFLAGIIALPLMMLVTTLAGRIMGPVEYGKYSLLLVINQFLVIFIFFGLDTTSVKYIAKAETFRDKKRVISTTANFIFLMLGILVLITIVAYPFLLKYVSNFSIFAVLLTYYTVIVSIKVIFDLMIRGLEEFKKQAIGKIIESFVVVLVFAIAFLWFKKVSFSSFLLVLNIGALALSLYYFKYLAKYFGKSDKKLLKQHLSESKLFFISALLGTLYISADRLVIANSMGVKALGIYSAYYLGSYGVVSQMTQLFTNVFFPVTSRLEDKTFANKIDRLLLTGFLPLSFLAAISLLVVLWIFGKEYPVTLIYVLGFAFLSSLNFFQALYNTVIADVSKEVYKKYLIARNLINLASILLFGVAIYIHMVSITLVLLALIINQIASIFCEKTFIKGMQN